MIHAFHDQRFPVNISLGATGGPRRNTEVVELVSGKEHRNARQRNSRRRYNAGYGMKSIDDLYRVVSFFEERRGRLCGFRFRDPLDHSSTTPSAAISSSDQLLGVGDGRTNSFKLVKQYGDGDQAYWRAITKPVERSLMIEVNGVALSEGDHFNVDYATGQITFLEGFRPQTGQKIHAGYLFDVPVRFDTDEISVNLKAFQAGEIPSIPLVELLS